MNLQERIRAAVPGGEVVAEHPWLQENIVRRDRWKRYTEGKHPLKDDPAIKHYQMNEKQIDTMRRQMEVEMDSVMIKAHESARKLLPGLDETTTTSAIATYTNTALALIRKIWPRLFAFQMVSVQPMSGPTTRAFSLDFLYGTTDTYAAGTSIYPNEDPDYSDDPGECSEPNEINASIVGATITAVAKKLKINWSQEADQDAAAQFGINLPREVANAAQMQIEREINRTVINGVNDSATTNTNWAATQPVTPDPWSNANPRQYAVDLMSAIVDADNEIFTRVYEHANFILCGPAFATRLRKMNEFRQIDRSAGEANVVSGPGLFGVLNDTYKVYHDPFYTSDKAIVGLKSDQWLYTGYVFLPYVAMWSTPVIWNTTMCPSQGFMSRYGTYAKNGDFFATVTVA